MSYDIGLTVDHQDGYRTHIDVGNMTSNVSQMMTEACGVSFPWFNNMTAKQALPIVASAWRQMSRNRAYFRKFEVAEWGSLDDFMPYLTKFYVLLRLHPTATIHVSY